MNYKIFNFTRIFYLSTLVLLSLTLRSDIDLRVESYISQMTLAEKVKMLTRNESSWSYSGCERLGIPDFKCHDGPHGVRDKSSVRSTAFPTTAARGASFDRTLAYKIAEAEEFLAQGWDMRLGNCVDVNRHPLYGRASESAGEDPYLCAEIGVAGVLGTQDTGCIANVKHLILNTKEDPEIRKDNQAVIDERSLMEMYGYPFKEAIQRGGAWSLMTAHSRVNGLHSTGNPYVLKKVLRDYWGFRYFVLNDWSSVHDVINQKEGTVADVFNNGHDLEANTQYFEGLVEEVKAGRVKEARLDEAVSRVLKVLLLSGLVDGKKPGNRLDHNSPKHAQLCRDAARKSIVLLKNKGHILPLNKSKKIALIGPNAAILPIDGRGSARVIPPYAVAPLQGFSRVAENTQIQYAKGCEINSQKRSGFASAIELAESADYVVFVGGLDHTQEGESQDRLSGSSALPGVQQELINELAKVNPNIVLVVISGGICSLEKCIDNVSALVYSFYPGQEGGNAIADVIFGNYNPAGRLPVSMPKNDAQLAAFDDDHRQHLFKVGYRWFDEKGFEPEFAFGHGLSYTNFEYSNLRLSEYKINAQDGLEVLVDIENTGEVDGDEVVQLYISDLESSVKMPLKQLKGFERVHLRAGEKQTVKMPLKALAMSYWHDGEKKFFVEKGDFKVMLGGASDKLVLEQVFLVKRDYFVPDFKPTREIVPAVYKALDHNDLSKPKMYRMKGAEFSNKSSGVKQKGRFTVLGNGDWICFKNQDLGSWLNSINIQAGASHHNSIIKIHLNDPKGKNGGQAIILRMGDLYKSKTSVIGTSDYGLSGVHDIYLKHVNENEPDALCTVLWLEWEQ